MLEEELQRLERAPGHPGLPLQGTLSLVEPGPWVANPPSPLLSQDEVTLFEGDHVSLVSLGLGRLKNVIW